MKLLSLLTLPILAFAEPVLDSPSLHKIGLQVWQNECRGTLDGLITWSEGEDFPSLGIGHFIWYPKSKAKKFDETFPAFIAFLKEQDKERDIPSWLTKSCPWKTREEFLAAKRKKKMLELRDLLSSTLDEQFLFLFEQFQLAEKKLVLKLSSKELAHLRALKKSKNGLYTLIDYVNFKGTGLSLSERYRGKGWGLLQVLQHIPENTPEGEMVSAFVTSAKAILHDRARNAPSHRNEDRWIKGWFSRLETYSKTL